MNEGNQTRRQDFVSLVLAIKDSVMKDLKVCDVYVVENISDTIVCHSINNVDERVFCVSIDGLQLTKDDVVLVLFTDHEFKTNLNRIKNDLSIQTITSKSTHSKTNAIVIAKLYSKENENASES